MPLAALAPSIPGVTTSPTPEKRLPSVLEALKKPAMSGERARALMTVAKQWYDSHRWYYREATECAAHDQGAQWGYWNDVESRWVGAPLSAEPDQIRITVNLTKPIIDQATAMLTQDQPIMRPVAATSEGSDGAAAEAARAINEHLWRYHGLDDIYRDTARAAFSTGTSFVLVEWDATLGPLGVQTDPGGQPLLQPGGVDELGQPILSPVIGPLGDLRYRVVQRDQVAFDPASRMPGGGDGFGVLVRWKESRTKLMELFPDKFEELPDSENSETSFTEEERIQRYSPATGVSSSGVGDKAESLDVYVWYLRSRTGRPRGDMLVFTETMMLLEGENDIYPSYEEIQRGELWPSENWPLFALFADKRENCPWGRARTVDLIPIQHGVNGAFSKALQHTAIVANAKIAVPAGLDVEWTDEPGQIIRYPRQFAPGSIHYLTPAQIPQEYMVIVNTARELMENTAGVNAASMGNAPTSDASGRLSQSLQQRDLTRILPIKRGLDNTWGRIQTYALRQYRRYATGSRKILVVGENQATALMFFESASLAAGTDIVVLNDQSLPREPQARFLALMNLTTMMGQLQSQEDKDLILDLAHLSDFAAYREKKSPHHLAAVRNTRLLLAGETPLPAPWDNPLIHKAEVERFGTSEEYVNKVKKEKADPVNGGQSPLEQRTVWLWSYWTQQSMPMPPAMPGGAGPPGAGGPQGLAMTGSPQPSPAATPAMGQAA